MLAERIERKNPIAHAAGRRQFTVRKAQFTNQRVRVDVIEIVTSRDLRGFV